MWFIELIVRELRKEFEEERWEVKAGDQWTIDKWTKQKSFGPFQSVVFCNAETGEEVNNYKYLPELRMDDADEQMVDQYKDGKKFDDTGHVLINRVVTTDDDTVQFHAFRCDYPHVVSVSNNALSADSKLVVDCQGDRLLLKSGVVVSLKTIDDKVLLLRRNDRFKIWSGLTHFLAWNKGDCDMSDIIFKTAMSAIKTVFDTNILEAITPGIHPKFDISFRHTISSVSRGGPQYSSQEPGERLYSTVECVIPVAVNCSSEELKFILNNIISAESGVSKFTDYALVDINTADYTKAFGLPVDDTGEVSGLSFFCRPVLESATKVISSKLSYASYFRVNNVFREVNREFVLMIN